MTSALGFDSSGLGAGVWAVCPAAQGNPAKKAHAHNRVPEAPLKTARQFTGGKAAAKPPVPEARLKRHLATSCFSRPSGTGFPLTRSYPALNGRAIVSRPSGTRRSAVPDRSMKSGRPSCTDVLFVLIPPPPPARAWSAKCASKPARARWNRTTPAKCAPRRPTRRRR